MQLNFVVRPSKVGRDGTAPIECSIIQQKERKVITLDRRLNPKHWNATKQKAKNDSSINDYINAVRTKFFSIEIELLKMDESISLSNIINIYKNGFSNGNRGLLNYYQSYLDEIRGLQTTSYDEYQKHRIVLSYLKEFFKSDIPLKNVTPKHLNDFHNFLLSEKKHKINSANQKMKKVKKILQLAVDERIIASSPFKIKLQDELLKYDVLTVDELRRIKQKQIDCERLAKMRDILLVLAYTGLAYTDLKNLTKDNIQGDVIIKNRHKTDVQSTIPLLPIVREILEKYDYKLPIPSNQKCNVYLKEIVAICGINKDIHCHSLRHSFATNLLNNGVDLHTVSRVCGHSNTKITEKIYAKLETATIQATVFQNAEKLV